MQAKPAFIESDNPRYDVTHNIIYAPNKTGNAYHHEYAHYLDQTHNWYVHVTRYMQYYIEYISVLGVLGLLLLLIGYIPIDFITLHFAAYGIYSLFVLQEEVRAMIYAYNKTKRK